MVVGYIVYIIVYYFRTKNLRNEGYEILHAAENFVAPPARSAPMKKRLTAPKVEWPAEGASPGGGGGGAGANDSLAKMLGGMSEQQIVDLHKAMDHDNSGACDLEEFEKELAKRGVPVQNEAVARLLLDADTDGDGEISLNELLALCKKIKSGG